MKKIHLKSLSSLLVIFLLLLSSCNDENFNLATNDSQNVENEAATDGYFEDADDMVTLAVAVDASTASGARESSNGREGVKPDGDKRFSCATITFEFANDNSQDKPHGFIIINFGEGCTDAKGNIRKGKIKVEFIGRRFFPDSKIITTFIEYSINGIMIEGTRTITNVSGSIESNPKFSIVLIGGKATWPDGSTATREVNHTREWVRGNNPLTDQWIVEGTSSGTNRNEKAYQVKITKPLVYKRECAVSNKIFIPVEGIKELTVENKIITIDYGSGECDKVVTVTINGQSKTIEVKGDN